MTTRPPPKILFVHDGASAEEHIKYLTDVGLTVDDVDARNAVARAVEWQPDVIVLDFSANGELTAQLKAHEATKQIPIIALAAFTGEQ